MELFADDSRLVRGLNAASKRLAAWGQSVTAAGQRMLSVGMGAAGGLFGASGVFASMGDTLAKASQRTGIGVERLSELGYAAEQSGADLETLESGVRRMQKTLADAAGGSQSAQEALAALGLSVQQLMGLSPDEQFMLIAEQLAEIADPTQRAAAAMELFGRSGTQLLPMIAQGAAGIDALASRARELGLVAAQAGEVQHEGLDLRPQVAKSLGREETTGSNPRQPLKYAIPFAASSCGGWNTPRITRPGR